MVKQPRHDPVPMLEWIAAGLGALVVLAMLAIIGSSAAKHDPRELPQLQVQARQIAAAGGGYGVRFTVRNDARRTAKQVEIEGELGIGDTAETASATLDYVPGRSEREGALVFAEDPRGRPLELKVTGFELP